MGNPYPCFECQAIVEEFTAACSAIEVSPLLNPELCAAYQELLAVLGAGRPRVSDELQSAHDAVMRMVGGTEQDAERAEEMLRRLPPRRPNPAGISLAPFYRFPRLRDVIHRLVLHRARTGHMVAARR